MLIKLHGIIARKFKEELYVPSKIDESFLFDILNLNFNGFKLFIQRQAQCGTFYQSVKVGEDYHIVPVIAGSIGMVAGFLVNLGGQLASSFVGNFVTSTVTQGIMGMLNPVEDQSVGAKSAVVLQSTRFSGLENKERQGSKIPVGYGRLRVGSKLIMQHKQPINWSEFREVENVLNFSRESFDYLNPAI
jgi:hypothetical protein